jgi:hypothetical protein
LDAEKLNDESVLDIGRHFRGGCGVLVDCAIACWDYGAQCCFLVFDADVSLLECVIHERLSTVVDRDCEMFVNHAQMHPRAIMELTAEILRSSFS